MAIWSFLRSWLWFGVKLSTMNESQCNCADLCMFVGKRICVLCILPTCSQFRILFVQPMGIPSFINSGGDDGIFTITSSMLFNMKCSYTFSILLTLLQLNLPFFHFVHLCFMFLQLLCSFHLVSLVYKDSIVKYSVLFFF